MSDSQLVSQIDDAIGAHGMWKMRLRTALRTGQCEISAHDAGCDDKCKFDHWLHSSALSPALKNGVPYQVVKRLHADFHRAAGEVLADALAGRKARAEALIEGDFTARSEKLVRALMKWKGEAQAGTRHAA
ncbi:MAG: CZB domain-containing protein [Sphingomonadales bacterium]|nr:CZB domain-containing protein [Sphingomonadales bacterium]